MCSDDDVINGRKVSWITGIQAVRISNMLCCVVIYPSYMLRAPTETTIVSKSIGETSVADAPLDTQYMMAFYWAVTTMTTVGYGDIKPYTHHEVVACIFAMIIGAYIFSYVVGNISNLIGQLGGDEAAFREKMEAITVFMHTHHVPKDLKLRIRKYYDYSFSNPFVEVSKSDLSDLSAPLQRELLKFFRKNILATSTLFHAAVGENEQRIMLQVDILKSMLPTAGIEIACVCIYMIYDI